VVHIQVSTEHDVPLFAVEGEIDHGNMSELAGAIDRALSPTVDRVLLDLTNVTYIDSGGLSVLYTVVQRLQGRGWLGVINPGTDVLRLLEIIGLTSQDAFRVFPDRLKARAAAGAPA
jgi:anti-anti-sigma factor